MRSGGGAILIVVGILLLWMAVTGKLDCFFGFMQCLLGDRDAVTDYTAEYTANGASGAPFAMPPNFPPTTYPY